MWPMQLLRVSQSFRSIIKKAHSLSSTAFEQRGTGKNRNTAVASVHRSIMLNITSTHQKKKWLQHCDSTQAAAASRAPPPHASLWKEQSHRLCITHAIIVLYKMQMKASAIIYPPPSWAQRWATAPPSCFALSHCGGWLCGHNEVTGVFNMISRRITARLCSQGVLHAQQACAKQYINTFFGGCKLIYFI